MRDLRQGLMALVAIFAITLHGLLATLSPVSAAVSGFDPLAITCLTGGHDAAAPQDGSTPAPTHKCDHCVLCLATALPAPAIATTAWTPTPAGGVPHPPAPRLAVTSEARPHFPRGPPQVG